MKIELKKYTKKTSGRFKDSGEFSGQWFRDQVIIPVLNQELIYINLKEVEILPSFLDECFGGLIRNCRIKNFTEKFKIQADENILFQIMNSVCSAQMLTFGKVYSI